MPARNRPRLTRDEQKQQSRDALILAALELFTEQGIDGPSLDAICERAGYTRGAFYVHFHDREELLVAVMGQVGNAFLASVFEHQRHAAEARGGRQLHDAASRFVEAVTSGRYPLMGAGAEPVIRPHQLFDACARSSTVRAQYRHLVEASIAGVASLAAADQRAGGVRTDIPAEDVGRLALALIVGAQTLAEIGVPLDAPALATSLVALLTSRDGGASR